MDGGTGVAARSATAGGVIDQAIFTSIRSPMARGYRLVACSAGWSEDEKRELVQRAPSHGNLSDASDQARAMAGFSLRSGRFCLLFARHAGPEPSGRGGLRVHTHALALTPALYRSFGHDPFAVEKFVSESIDAALRNTPSGGMPALSVSNADNNSTKPAVAPGLLLTLDGVLGERSMCVLGATNPEAALHSIVHLTPLRARRSLSFSLGMKCCAQRDFQLLFHSGSAGEIEQLVLDHHYTVVNWNAPLPVEASPFSPWLGFVAKSLLDGSLPRLLALVDELDEFAPQTLTHVAELCNDLPTIARLDEMGLARLAKKYAEIDADGVVARLRDELNAAIDARFTALVPPPPPQPMNPQP